MITIRLYACMGHPVIEATCWHGDEPSASHLLYRSEGSVGLDDPVDLLEFCSDAVGHLAREIVYGNVDVTDDCALL